MSGKKSEPTGPERSRAPAKTAAPQTEAAQAAAEPLAAQAAASAGAVVEPTGAISGASAADPVEVEPTPVEIERAETADDPAEIADDSAETADDLAEIADDSAETEDDPAETEDDPAETESDLAEVGAVEAAVDPALPRSMDLPTARGYDFIALMARDPLSIFFYWEVTAGGVVRAQMAMGDRPAELVVRLYVSEREAAAHTARILDVPVSQWLGRYVYTLEAPGQRVLAAVGLRAQRSDTAHHPSDFVHIAQSAPVDLPRLSPGSGPLRFSRLPEGAHPSGTPALPPAQWVQTDPGEGWRGLPENFAGSVPEYLLVKLSRGSGAVAGSQHLMKPSEADWAPRRKGDA